MDCSIDSPFRCFNEVSNASLCWKFFCVTTVLTFETIPCDLEGCNLFLVIILGDGNSIVNPCLCICIIRAIHVLFTPFDYHWKAVITVGKLNNVPLPQISSLLIHSTTNSATDYHSCVQRQTDVLMQAQGFAINTNNVGANETRTILTGATLRSI